MGREEDGKSGPKYLVSKCCNQIVGPQLPFLEENALAELTLMRTSFERANPTYSPLKKSTFHLSFKLNCKAECG